MLKQGPSGASVGLKEMVAFYNFVQWLYSLFRSLQSKEVDSSALPRAAAVVVARVLGHLLPWIVSKELRLTRQLTGQSS